MFISKKKHQALVAERDKWKEIALETRALNDKMLTELKDMHRLANKVNGLNEQLIERNKQLKKARDYAVGMAEYYKDLLESETEEEDHE